MCVLLADGGEQQLGQSEDSVPGAALAPDGREQFGGGGSHGGQGHLLGGDHSSAGMSHFGLELTKAGLHNTTKLKIHATETD